MGKCGCCGAIGKNKAGCRCGKYGSGPGSHDCLLQQKPRDTEGEQAAPEEAVTVVTVTVKNIGTTTTTTTTTVTTTSVAASDRDHDQK